MLLVAILAILAIAIVATIEVVRTAAWLWRCAPTVATIVLYAVALAALVAAGIAIAIAGVRVAPAPDVGEIATAGWPVSSGIALAMVGALCVANAGQLARIARRLWTLELDLRRWAPVAKWVAIVAVVACAMLIFAGLGDALEAAVAMVAIPRGAIRRARSMREHWFAIGFFAIILAMVGALCVGLHMATVATTEALAIAMVLPVLVSYRFRPDDRGYDEIRLHEGVFASMEATVAKLNELAMDDDVYHMEDGYIVAEDERGSQFSHIRHLRRPEFVYCTFSPHGHGDAEEIGRLDMVENWKLREILDDLAADPDVQETAGDRSGRLELWTDDPHRSRAQLLAQVAYEPPAPTFRVETLRPYWPADPDGYSEVYSDRQEAIDVARALIEEETHALSFIDESHCHGDADTDEEHHLVATVTEVGLDWEDEVASFYATCPMCTDDTMA